MNPFLIAVTALGIGVLTGTILHVVLLRYAHRRRQPTEREVFQVPTSFREVRKPITTEELRKRIGGPDAE